MRTVFDEIVAVAIKRVTRSSASSASCSRRDRRQEARSIKYQMTNAKLPTVKELADFDFALKPGQRTAGAGPGHRRVPGKTTQPRAGRPARAAARRI